MEKRMVRLGWIGCGQHSKRDLLIEVVNLKSVHKTVICDLNNDVVQACAVQFGFNQFYSDYVEMFEKESLDAVVIVGPPQLHENAAEEALKRGIHVFCEKPVSLSSSTIKKLSELAHEKKCKTQVGHFLRYAPAIVELRSNLNNQLLGKPTSFTGTYHTYGPWELRTEWNSTSLLETYLYVQGIHLIDLVEHVLGPIKSIQSAYSISETNRISVSCLVELQSGINGTLELSSSAPSWSTTFTILTDKQLEVSVENGTKYSIKKKADDAKSPLQLVHQDFGGGYGLNYPNGYLAQLQAFIDSIIYDQNSYPDLHQAFSTTKWIEQIRQED
jgi:predicted dehydrogenase